MDDNDLHKAGKLGDMEEGAVPMPKAATPDPLRPICGLLDEALRRAEARRSGQERPIPLPWSDMLEQFGGGFWPGMHVLVGGTGAGKTSWALQVATHAAKAGFPVGYVGLELEDMQIALRLLAEEAKVPWSALYLGKASETDMSAAHASKAAIASMPFYVEMGRPNGWPISELEAFIAKMRAAHPEATPGALPMLVVLDFLQIVGDESRGDGRMMGLDLRERIGRAAYFARDAARRHNVAVLLVSSTARDNYKALSGEELAGIKADLDGHDANGRPKAKRTIVGADRFVGLGKESGEVEYSADSVTAAIRTSVELEPKKTSFAFITAKGRATGAGWCELRFNGFRFDEAHDRGIGLAEELAKLAAKHERARGPRATREGTGNGSGDEERSREGIFRKDNR